MARTALDNVVSHWNKLVESFQTSAKDFYTAVEAALDQREIPGLKVSRVDWKEGGVLSPKREYLRITGGRYTFDVCASPFGTGYFFSSWLVKRPARFVLAFFLAFLVAGWFIFRFLRTMSVLWVFHGNWIFLGPMAAAILAAIALLTAVFELWLIAICARLGWDDPEAAIMAVPILGGIYEVTFAPQTYYRLDTVSMFRTAADGAVKDTVDGLLTAKGLRALTEDERKPVFQKLL
jgi:hypothetical protein